MTDPVDQVATVYIGGTFLAAVLAAKGVNVNALLVILIIIAVTAVALGYIEAGQRRKQ